jgi:hypothetical protein
LLRPWDRHGLDGLPTRVLVFFGGGGTRFPYGGVTGKHAPEDVRKIIEIRRLAGGQGRFFIGLLLQLAEYADHCDHSEDK